jgi:hypothetical protein
MRTKKQIGKLSRNKGHSFERLIAKKFRPIFPDAKRHLEYQKSEARGFDLDGVGEYKVQCKRGRKYANPSAIEEIQLCPIEGGIPVLITQGDFKEPMAVLPLEHFLNLLRRVNKK